MKKVKIKYNPYIVETEITVDGQKPKANSALNVGKKRLQEWVEKLPKILLDEYRDKTQFILITHKKKTMEFANTLYGITMQESGVSKLVSVRLEDIENDKH